jgi:hypothetical protein
VLDALAGGEGADGSADREAGGAAELLDGQPDDGGRIEGVVGALGEGDEGGGAEEVAPAEAIEAHGCAVGEAALVAEGVVATEGDNLSDGPGLGGGVEAQAVHQPPRRVGQARQGQVGGWCHAGLRVRREG